MMGQDKTLMFRLFLCLLLRVLELCSPLHYPVNAVTCSQNTQLNLMAEMVMRAAPPGSSSSSDISSVLDHSKITFPLSALAKANIVPKHVITQIQQGLHGAISHQGGEENYDQAVDVKSNL